MNEQRRKDFMEFYMSMSKYTLATLVLRLGEQNNEWREIAIELGWEPEVIA